MSSRRASPAFAASFLLLVVVGPSFAARPELDVASTRRPAAAARERLARLMSDPGLAVIATPAHVDERYGVPSFVWATRGSRPATPATSTSAVGRGAEQAARDHLARIAPYFGLDEDDVRGASLREVHDTGVGGIIVSLRQEVDGIEVFRDEVKVLMDRDLELSAVSGFIPGKAEAGRAEARAFRIAANEAIARALADFNGTDVGRGAIRRQGPAPGGYEMYAIDGFQPIRAKRVLFHLPGELVPGYYIELIDAQEGVAYVVSAADGEFLFRHSLIQNDAYTYRVWADNTAIRAPFDGPTGNGVTPHPTGTPDLYRPTFVPPVLQTLQNGPISTNDPWLPPGATTTVGNNVDAYADLSSPDGFSAGDLRASTTAPNVFDRIYDTSLDPEASTSQTMASVTQLFYTNNFLHDWFYDAGFNEAARNAQTSNFGRGGVPGDALKVEAQDYLMINNADMLVPADGASPRMQMYEFFHFGGGSLTVNSPAGIAGAKTCGGASFNPWTFNLTADVVPISNGTFAVTGTSTLASAPGPEFVTSADVNADSYPDLLCANVSGIVSVWPGNGAGGFGPRSDFAVGAGTYVVATGDVNGDNKLDLATANYSAGTVSVLLGTGTGWFGSRLDLPSGPNTSWVVLADVSGDSKLDLISSNFGASNVAVRLGNGSGGFSGPVTYASGANPNAVLVGDMNGDGKGDLVTANYGASSVSVLLGDGSGGFGTKTDFACGANPLTCALGDLNHDQKLDVVTADYGANTVSILLGTGSGTLGSPVPTVVPTGPVTVVVGDLNDDPYADLAVCCDAANSVSILIGNGAGGVAAPVTYPAGTVPYGMHIGDVNGDGEPDLVAGNYTSNDLTVFTGSATPITTGCNGPSGTYVNSVAGKIALIDRGGLNCSFEKKMQNALSQGAVGVIVVNNVPGVIEMPGSGTSTIPSLMVSPEDGAAMRAAFANGPVTVTMQRFPVIRDGAIDNTIVAHEWGHYLSHRLVGNSGGLTNLQGGGMSEGWGDFVALLLTVKPEDAAVPSNPNYSGVYGINGYCLDNAVTPSNTYYFGFRRYPYSTDLTKNPLTFQHIQAGVPLPAGPPMQLTAPDNWEVHNTGEVWCSMLWECYASLLRATSRLTFEQARTRMRQYAVASLKLTPNSPTFVEARDAMLAVAGANDPADFIDFCNAFAKRGMGTGAIAPGRSSSDLIGVTESYVCGGDLQVVSATLDDAVHACDADSVLDEGEVGRLTVTVRNIGGTTLSATTATLSSTNSSLVFQSGPTLVFPPSTPLATTTAQAFIRSSGASGMQNQDVLIQCNDPGLFVAGSRTLAFATLGNIDVFASTAEHVEAPNPGWTYSGTTTGIPAPWGRITISPFDHRFFGPDALVTSDQSLVSPPLQVGAGPFSFTFRHAYSFEVAQGIRYDGGVVEISTDGSSWSDIGASITPGYNGTITNTSGNPLGGRSAFTAQSGGYPGLVTATASLGTTYAGQTVRIRFRIGTDAADGALGWHVDDLVFTGLTNNPFLDVVADPGPCTPVAVEESLPTELSFAIAGAQPSRRAPSFQFALPRPTRVEITVHDIAGRRVARLAEGEYAAGVHEARWDNASGRASGPGIYFARMIAEGRVITRRVVMLSR